MEAAAAAAAAGVHNRSTKDLNELKRQALGYYKTNKDVPRKIEDALNTLFFDSPYDIYGYLSDYFVAYAKPAFITHLNANKAIFYDAKGQPTFQLDVYCNERNREKRIISLNSPCVSIGLVNDSAKASLIQDDDAHRASKLADVLHLVNGEISELVKNYSPLDQDELDEKLRNFFHERQLNLLQKHFLDTACSETTTTTATTTTAMDGHTTVSRSPVTTPKKDKDKKTRKASHPQVQQVPQVANAAIAAANGVDYSSSPGTYLNVCFFASFLEPFISKAVCLTAIRLNNKQPFEYIAEMSESGRAAANDESYKMPVPLITVLQNGKGFLGKQQLIKEFILVPTPGFPLQKQIEVISHVNRSIRDSLYQSKTQPGAMNKCVTEQGALTCALETPQQGLDMIESALSHGDHLRIAVNIGASEIFDAEKAKYEVAAGLFKSSDELLDTYADLVAKYPRICMIIDPYRENDTLAWYKLHVRMRKSGVIVCSQSAAYDTYLVNNLAEFEKRSELSRTRQSIEQHVMGGELGASSSPPRMPLTLVKYESGTNVSEVSTRMRRAKAHALLTGLMCGQHETDDTFLIDLSVGNQVDFVRIGGFNRSERVSKINRLVEIEAYLSEHAMLQMTSGADTAAAAAAVRSLEIPAEYAEAVHAYAHSLEEAQGKMTKGSIKK